MPEETKRGSNGGAARAKKLSKEERSRIAREAASRRWSKKKNIVDPPENVGLNAGIPAEITSLEPTTYATYGGIERGSIPMNAPNITPPLAKDEPPQELHCSGCANGDGNHFAGTVEHPFNPVTQIVDTPPVLVEPTPPPVQQKPVKRTPKPMPKEFKSASSYAEKRLPIAIKEKSEHVGAVAKLDAEINDLVRVIKALGGHVDPQAYSQPQYPMASPYQAQTNVGYPYPTGQPGTGIQAPPDPGIDPALFRVNTGPVPGAGSALPQQIPLVPNTSLGGAMDLDYTPREEEETGKLPNMGNGWV